MNTCHPRTRIQDLIARSRSLLVPVAPLLARLVFGQGFLLTGLGKLRNLDDTITFFADLGIPFASLQAPMIGTLELVGGTLLLLGLWTRVAALLLSGTMVVAILTAHAAEIADALLFRGDLSRVLPMPFLVALAWLMANGPGPFSLDAIRRRPATSTMVATG
jgi:putative oxidoreductase